MNPLLIVAGTILVVSMFYNGILKFKVNGLEDDVSELTLEVQASAMNNTLLKRSLEAQNHNIDLQKIDIVLKNKKLEEWKSKPEKIRYNVIYKEIPEYVDIRKADCETTQQTINAIRSIDFSTIN